MTYTVMSLDQYGHQTHGMFESYHSAFNHKAKVQPRIGNHRCYVSDEVGILEKSCPNCGNKSCDGMDCVDEKHLPEYLRP